MSKNIDSSTQNFLQTHCSFCVKTGPVCTKLNSAGENTDFYFTKLNIWKEKTTKVKIYVSLFDS